MKFVSEIGNLNQPLVPETLKQSRGHHKLGQNFHFIIVKQCFLVQIKFNTEDSNAVHTIITTR